MVKIGFASAVCKSADLLIYFIIKPLDPWSAMQLQRLIMIRFFRYAQNERGTLAVLQENFATFSSGN